MARKMELMCSAGYWIYLGWKVSPILMISQKFHWKCLLEWLINWLKRRKNLKCWSIGSLFQNWTSTLTSQILGCVLWKEAGGKSIDIDWSRINISIYWNKSNPYCLYSQIFWNPYKFNSKMIGFMFISILIHFDNFSI